MNGSEMTEAESDPSPEPVSRRIHIDDAKLIAYVDESCKPVRDPSTRRVMPDRYRYVLACAIVFEADIDAGRCELSRLEASLGKSLHYRELAVTAREAALEHAASLDSWEGALFETSRDIIRQRHSEHHVRAKLLERALRSLSETFGVAEIVMESRSRRRLGPGQLDQKDHQVLRKTRGRGLIDPIALRHDDKSEVMLRLPDLLAGARTDHLCGVDRTAFALIANRVRVIEQWPEVAP